MVLSAKGLNSWRPGRRERMREREREREISFSGTSLITFH
jgi:hypothetical protein